MSDERATLDAIRRARDAIVRAYAGGSFSLIEHAVAEVSRDDLRRDLLRFARRADDRSDGPWFEARGVWNLRERVIPPWLPFVRSLDLWRCHEVDASTAAWVASLDALRDLRRLRVDECGLSEGTLVALATGGSFPRLHHLTLNGNFGSSEPCGGDTIAQLFSHRWGRGLRELDLSDNAFTADAFEAFGRASALRHVRALRARYLRPGARGMRSLLRRGAWPELTSLELDEVQGADEAVPVLFASPVVERLSHLSLSTGGLPAPLVSTLVEAVPRMTALTSLDLSGNKLGDEGAALLARAAMPPSLRRLTLHSCGFSAEGFAALAAAPWAAGLESAIA